jgi:class 3 adenylate cyclase/tetratricopeptide (TPR) repeat protein
VAAPPEEERRIVSILFVDLVGFTERSDRADPEDVRRTLIPFHGRVKEDLERFGGTLDKFIGDAVMGVFGAPVAHEDDPVRAVRCALRILDSIEELRRDDPALAVRVAVNTGEAVVTFGSGPQVGEAVAGYVVNTASRMQSLAPGGSVVIGETTLRAVRDAFDVEPLPPAVVKGKSEPLSVWRVLSERSGVGGDVRAAPFVGREQELALLRQLFDRAVTGSSFQIVTLVAEPGIGKSRLVEEFRSRIGGVRWLSSRSLPYGEEGVFAPLAEIVRDVAEIDPSHGAAEAAERLADLVARAEPDASERRWLESRLRPLLGLGGGSDETISATETAQAWARVLSSEPGPLVLELEDLHWADDVLVEAVEALASALARHPVLLLVTARPEFLDRHAGFAARRTNGRTNATTISLERLSPDDTARLVSELVASTVLPAPARAELVERAGGNPLYALEFARMLSEQARAGDAEEIALPESVQAVIAARLDAIPAEQRSIVLDASVVGNAVWPGALAALSERQADDVRTELGALVHRGILAGAEPSTFAGEPEYVFTHALIREVAYARIPRAQRARRHLAAGRWIEHASGDRADERSEMLARHFATAVDLAVVAGEADVAESARSPAIRWLMTAAQRASRLDARGAFELADRAVMLTPAGSSDRAEALTLSALMGRRSNELDGEEVLRRYEEAYELFRELGDRLAAGSALTRIGSQAGALGDGPRSREMLAKAIEVLEREPPGEELARAYAFRAEEGMFAGRNDEAKAFADRALGLLAGSEGEIAMIALHIRGDARAAEGDEGGLEDLEEALRIAHASGDAVGIATSENYLAEWAWAMRGPAAGLGHFSSSLEVAERRGLAVALWAKVGLLGAFFDLGEWDRALEVAGEMLSVGRERLDGSLEATARIFRARILTLRGRDEDAGAAEELLEVVRPVEELQVLAPGLVVAADISAARGDLAGAAAFLEEFAEVTRGVAAQYREAHLAEVVRLCIRAGRNELAARLVEESRGVVLRDRLYVVSARASLMGEGGDNAGASEGFAEAAEGWRAFEDPYEEAQALFGLARTGADKEGDRARAAELLAKLGVPGGGAAQGG